MPTLKFVDSVASSPTTRLDLNSFTATTGIKMLRGFNPGLPAKRTQVSESGLTDGGTFASSVYGLRTLTIPLQLYGSDEVRAETIHDLAVELDRDSNYLMYQPDGMSNPVFFQTLPSDAAIDLLNEGVDLTDFTLELQAQPFALGLKQTLSNVTLAANPASANGLNFTVTTPKGDVPTPLNLKFADSTKFCPSGTAPAIQTVVAVRRRGTVASMPFIFQCESMTANTDTALGVNSALYSGASNNNMLTTFVTTSLVTRLTATVPASASVDARGTYRVFAKIRPTTTATSVKVYWQYGSTAVVPLSGPIVTVGPLTAVTNAVFVDLGLLTLPAAQDPQFEGPSGSELAVGTGTFTLQASREAGAGNLVWDFIALVPADDAYGLVNWADLFASSSEHGYIDSYNRRAYVGTDTSVKPYQNIKSPTGYPMLTPGIDNRVFVLPDVRSSTSALSDYLLTQTHTVTPSYFPRYLYVRPSGS